MNELSACELQLVTLCRLEQITIAMQCHHALMGARLAMSMLKTISNARLFSKSTGYIIFSKVHECNFKQYQFN